MHINPKISAAAFAVCALTMSAPSSVLAEEKPAEKEMTKGEIRLAKLLEGRVAGEPQSCIHHRSNDRMQVIDDTAIVYGRGNTIYVNYTKDPSDIDDWDALVTRRYGASFCKTDIVTKVDRTSGMFAGIIFLDNFIPYRRVKKDES
jgi:hypothetical protein